MTVYELAELYLEKGEEMQIWDVDSEANVFQGSFDEVMGSRYADTDVASFGIEDGMIVINV